MKPFHAWMFLSAKGFLRNYATYNLIGRIPWLGEISRTAKISKSHRRIYGGAWDGLRPFAEELELQASVVTIDRMLACLADPKSKYEQYFALAAELESRLSDEMHMRTFLSLTMSEAAQYERPLESWEKVEAAFPDSAYDIEEASRCLALGRATAVVFHLMRAMEGALGVLSAKLGATVIDQHGNGLPWGMILSNLKAKIDALPKGPDQDDWYGVHAALHSVNRATRTKTAHPIQKYTEEEAHAAYVATKAFLLEMAER